MAEGEIVVLLVHAVVAIAAWWKWLRGVLGPKTLGRPGPGRFALCLAPGVAMGVLIGLLGAFAASDVVNTIYMAFYAVMGAAWIGVFCWLVGLMGVHPQGDVGERRNSAAAILLLGAVVGMSCAFAGSNFGDGPGWWVVAFCAAISMGTVLALWGLVGLCTNAVEAITIERDTPTAVRCGLLLAALGIVMGRAAAGDWIDVPLTLVDFLRFGWPALALAGAEVFVGLAMRPRPNLPPIPLPLFFRGALPGTAYVGLAIGAVLLAGWW